jgi:hypothetical protein
VYPASSDLIGSRVEIIIENFLCLFSVIILKAVTNPFVYTLEGVQVGGFHTQYMVEDYLLALVLQLMSALFFFRIGSTIDEISSSPNMLWIVPNLCSANGLNRIS